MIKLLAQTRRPDITFCRNGRIFITASVVRTLGLCPGDSINIAFHEEECLLFASQHHHGIGRHVAQCYQTKTGSRNFCANSVALCRAMLKACNVNAPRAAFFVGQAITHLDRTYLPIIYKMPL